MRRFLTTSGFVLLIAVACHLISSTAALAQSNIEPRTINDKTVQSERAEQVALYNYYFREQDLKYETKLDNLKTEASVANWRVPYSAAIHPESAGGLSSGGGGVQRQGLFGPRNIQFGRRPGSSPLSVYDQAFRGGDDLANAYEVQRIMGQSSALFPLLRMRINSESWEGYCSGFTAATIRHPEPIHPVDAGDVGGTPGVVFQPAHIKASGHHDGPPASHHRSLPRDQSIVRRASR